MSDYSSTSVPKPKNWQDFERHACILFKCILNDPNTTTHGRGGQPQQGVDIYGRRNGQGDHWVGVQCKLKGDAEEVTRAELEDEVTNAKMFEPALSELILITTAKDDAKIQKVAREITQRHEREGLFPVSVWGWQTVEREITRYPAAMEAFHPDLTPFSRGLMALGEESVALGKQSSNKQDYMILMLEQLTSAQRAGMGEGKTAVDTSSAADEAIEQNIHREVDSYRDLLRRGNAATAKGLLEALKARVWEAASARVRFRIVTNIGAACLELGEEEAAAKAFVEAIDYDPEDRVGMANVALAYLLRAKAEQAIAAAAAALQRDPANAAAAGHLILAHIGDRSVTDPFSLVPEGLRESAEVLASAINFLAQRGDASWRAIARQAAEKHPDKKLLRRRAAEGALDEVVSSERFELGGRLASNVTLDDLRNAASVLQELWDEARASETRRGDTALPQNLARAWWALSDSRAAAAVLEQALGRTPGDRELRELRAALHFDADEADAALALVGDDVSRPGLALMQAKALLKANPERAREILRGGAFSDAPEHQRLGAELLVVETFIQQRQPEQALQHAEQLVRDYEWSVEPLTQLARIQRLLGEGDSDQTLTRAVERLVPETRFLERFQVANALEEVDRHDDVISVLDGYVDYTHDSPALRLLTFSYINADRRKAAYELLQSLPPELASQPPYLKALVAVNANRKDFPAALRALDQYLALVPDDLEMRLRWASLCVRQGQDGRVAAFLDGNVEALSGSPHLRMELAQWLDHFGHSERALKLGYRVFLGHSRLPRIHLKYIGLLLRPGRPNTVSLETEFIDDHTAFEIDDGAGGKALFVIEPEVELRKDETYIAPLMNWRGDQRGLEQAIKSSGATRATAGGGLYARSSGYIWSNRPEKLETSTQTGLALESLLKGRADWRRVIAILRRIYRERFGRDGALDKYILGWLQGHFLVPFGEKSLPFAG